MHEMSLAHGMMQQVLALLREHGAERVTDVTVLLGPFSGVVAESFAFGFEVLKKSETCFQDATLHLELPDPHYRCLECGVETSLPLTRSATFLDPDCETSTSSRCPVCASTRLSPLGGAELILQQVRME
ncbi:MAG: hydrogenase maturation nickel metallochaperone HypA [Desulfobulbaceae bacterium]|nr:hydrogenase maturation nickel metallochaperone HypA [Desulfobulbaceae bacterium]